MKFSMQVILCCAMVLGFTGVSSAQAPFDDFSGSRIDGSKWFGQYWKEKGLIEVREVTGGKLVSKIGGRTSDNGIANNSTMLLPYPPSVTSFSAKINVIEAAYDPAYANSMYGLFAELAGSFYKLKFPGKIQAGQAR
ncbi:MAG TPA: hypothetical protein ENK84_04475 [Desulfobulbus sp.]|nr:hypothetical protein [Desulfobulbus sp.]